MHKIFSSVTTVSTTKESNRQYFSFLKELKHKIVSSVTTVSTTKESNRQYFPFLKELKHKIFSSVTTVSTTKESNRQYFSFLKELKHKIVSLVATVSTPRSPPVKISYFEKNWSTRFSVQSRQFPHQGVHPSKFRILKGTEAQDFQFCRDKEYLANISHF